jgi:hypothetical protein
VTSQATFGDYLHAGHHHLTGSGPPPARGDVDEVSRSLLRLITIMGRYLHDTAPAASDVPGGTDLPLGAWDKAWAQARDALTNAAAFLTYHGPGRRPWPNPPSASSLARRLDEVARSLTIGRDLLHTHFTPGPGGGRAHPSPWALAITSTRVNRALLTEIAALARPAAHHGANVALTPIGGAPANAGRRRRLNAACQWLWILSTSIEEARRAEPVPAADRDLLAAIPINALPARPVLEDTGTIAGLCDGVIATAERARYLAWHATSQAASSPELTITSMRQIAETSMVTSHNCATLADTLAVSTPAYATPAARASLAATATAGAARQAGRAWYQIARELRQVTTDTRGHISPAATEAHDLALWTGRLAYTDPTWTPASGPHHPQRPPHDLTAQPVDLPLVVAAVHHACDTLTLLAQTGHSQMDAAIHARRLLVPTRTLPLGYDIPRPYAPAPPDRIAPILATYRQAAHAGQHAAVAIGPATSATSAPSRVLTTAREAARATPSPSLDTGPQTQTTNSSREQPHDTAGPLQHTLLGLGITTPALLARSADLDHASQQLLIDAATNLPPTHKRPPATVLNQTAASAALLNHVLATRGTRAAELLRPPSHAGRKEPELEPEPEPEP